MKLNKILKEMICILLFSLAVSLVYNAVSPTGIKVLRHKLKEGQKTYPDTHSATVQEHPVKNATTAH
jgi:hypothetical protein